MVGDPGCQVMACPRAGLRCMFTSRPKMKGLLGSVLPTVFFGVRRGLHVMTRATGMHVRSKTDHCIRFKVHRSTTGRPGGLVVYPRTHHQQSLEFNSSKSDYFATLPVKAVT